jgi:probable F420-dependent oxidoreductase
MKIDSAGDIAATPAEVAQAAAAAEAAGYDGFAASETKHDVFTSLTLAASATAQISLESGIAVAFARNPMSVAMLANDLQLISAGRFKLGLGSQVRQHIERRYAMPWDRPAARMEEFIAAVRAIWACWSDGSRLAFRGEFYQHTLMTDFFNPGRNPHGNPPILLAAVGQRMTEVAGRIADGMLCHSFTTESYLRERTLPALRQARGTLDGFTLSLPVFVVLGHDEASRAAAARSVCAQIAFYGSTPAYRPVLDLHGWGGLHEQLNRLSRLQAWAEMGDLIDDTVLDAFAISGQPAEVAASLLARFGDVIDRVSLYTPYQPDPALVAATTEALRAHQPQAGQ